MSNSTQTKTIKIKPVESDLYKSGIVIPFNHKTAVCGQVLRASFDFIITKGIQNEIL